MRLQECIDLLDVGRLQTATPSGGKRATSAATHDRTSEVLRVTVLYVVGDDDHTGMQCDVVLGPQRKSATGTHRSVDRSTRLIGLIRFATAANGYGWHQTFVFARETAPAKELLFEVKSDARSSAHAASGLSTLARFGRKAASRAGNAIDRRRRRAPSLLVPRSRHTLAHVGQILLGRVV